MKRKISIVVISLLSVIFILSPIGDGNNKAHADVLRAKVDDVYIHTFLNPPNPYYHEAIIEGTKMAGWLTRKGIGGSGLNQYWIYEGYLYNVKYPIPSPAKITEEEI